MRKLSDRLIGSAAAIALQAGFLLLMLQSVHLLKPSAKQAQEMMLILPRLRPASVQEAAPRAPTPPIVLIPAMPDLPPPPVGAGPSTADVQGLGRALFGCAPEAYANLTPAERARCPKPTEGLMLQRDPDLMGTHSHVKDEAHWRQEWARVHSPGLLPCGGFVDLMCLLGKIMDGSLDDYGDPSKWPVYAVKQLPPEDFYKIQQTYDQSHKDHPNR